jgi:hypothetical protein
MATQIEESKIDAAPSSPAAAPADVEVALETESAPASSFAIGDPFVRIHFARETGVPSFIHPGMFFIGDAIATSVDPVAVMRHSFGQNIQPGDKIIVSIGEMDLLYRIKASFESGVEDFCAEASTIASNIAFFMRACATAHPTCKWVFSSLRGDPEFLAFFSMEKSMSTDTIPSLSVSRQPELVLPRLRSFVNEMVRLMLSDCVSIEIV